MELLEIRRTILIAVASDDALVQQLVLKGGNALELIHEIGSRASVDLDFSVATDFDDPSDVGSRLERALNDRFDASGYVVFDFKFGPRPRGRVTGTPWGGYSATFKIIKRERWLELGGRLHDTRRTAVEVGPSEKRSFKIEISVFEYIEERIEVDVDHYTCLVYSLDMIVAEKLRAICQQMAAYARRAHPTPRARDFYDIYTSLTEGGVALETELTMLLVEKIFDAKEVPLSLLGAIRDEREFHRTGWPSVEVAVNRQLRDFDFYFDYVVEELRVLEPLWVE